MSHHCGKLVCEMKEHTAPNCIEVLSANADDTEETFCVGHGEEKIATFLTSNHVRVRAQSARLGVFGCGLSQAFSSDALGPRPSFYHAGSRNHWEPFEVYV
jgi:hypothetical protein